MRVGSQEGWRRTKQTAAVKLFQATSTETDHELVGQMERVGQLQKQIEQLKEHTEGYLKSLVEMCYSGEKLTQTFADYVSEPGCELIEPAKHAASVWQELQKGATRALEQQFTQKVLKPIVGYLGEIEGIKKMHEARQKRLIDYDYYRRKMAEMQAKPPKDQSKVQRNMEKLQTSEVAYTSVNNELKARITALIDERWDFAAAPLTQMLDFQQSFYSNIASAVGPLAAYSTESRLLDAEARAAARETLKTDAITKAVAPTPVSAPRVPQVGQMAQIGYSGGPPACAPPAGYGGGPPPPSASSYAAPPPSSYAAPPPAGYGGGPPPPSASSYAAPPPSSYAAPPPSSSLALPPASGGMRYRAVSEYTPTDPRMISMSVGEIVTKEKDEGGWFFGSNSRGEQGYFPSSYVEPC